AHAASPDHRDDLVATEAGAWLKGHAAGRLYAGVVLPGLVLELRAAAVPHRDAARAPDPVRVGLAARPAELTDDAHVASDGRRALLLDRTARFAAQGFGTTRRDLTRRRPCAAFDLEG